jgi:hypothetical protein
MLLTALGGKILQMRKKNCQELDKKLKFIEGKDNHLYN